MGFISRLATTGLLVLAVSGGYRLLHNRNLTERPTAGREAPRPSSSIESEHFAPADNLERIERAELRAAADRLRNSRAPLNIAMYAFTDRAIGQLLTEEADAGTVIRVYRDGEQYEAEEREANKYGRGSVTSMFRGHRNVQVRVKPASRSDLMHLKCWSDGRVLRDGSANWSQVGLKRQDNEIRFTADPREVQAFNRNFEQLESADEYPSAVAAQAGRSGWMKRAKHAALMLCLFVLYCVLLSQGLKASAASAFFGALAAVPLTVHLYHRIWPPTAESGRRRIERVAPSEGDAAEPEYASTRVSTRSSDGQ